MSKIKKINHGGDASSPSLEYKMIVVSGVLLMLSIFTGCSSSSDGDGAGQTPLTGGVPLLKNGVLIDASAGGLGASPEDPKNKYTYFSFSSGGVLDLGDEAAKTSQDWDIAFKRSSIKLNGSFSGPKGTAGYFIGNNAEAYDADGKPVRSWFETATHEGELPDFQAAGLSDMPDISEFIKDELRPAIRGDGTEEGWWFYHGPPTHAVSAVSKNWWLVRSAEGDTYAKFHVTDLIRDSNTDPEPRMRRITLKIRIQHTGSSGFGVPFSYIFLIPRDAGGAVYFDFETEAEVSSDDAWDLKIAYDAGARSYRMLVNGGVSGTGKGGALALEDNPDSVTNGADREQAAHYFNDQSGGVFVDFPWNAYNITGEDHKLWPNYRVYFIQSEEAVYKLQVLSYYHPETAESAWYTLRYEALF